MKEKAKELEKVFEGLQEDAKASMSGLDKLIERNSMDPEEVAALIDNKMQGDMIHPELANVEKMTASEFAALYKKMAEDVKVAPEKYEAHAKAAGMTPDELSLLFASINGAIETHPEVWEAQQNAQLLSPKNLAIFVNAFKREK